MLGKIRDAASDAARAEVVRQMKPVVDKLVAILEDFRSNGIEAGIKAGGGEPLGSVWMLIPRKE